MSESFICKSKILHGSRYDYSLVDYINSKTKVKIICPKHGVFEMRPNDHISSGRGCRKCGSESTGSKSRNKKWKEDFIKIHGDKYDYSRVIYANNRTKVEVLCKIHGSFFIKPNAHTSQKQGCRRCGFFLVTNTEEFVSESNKMHKNKYDYSRSVYDHSHKKLEILCRQHGLFSMRPNDHIGGQGCPKCGKEDMANHFRKGEEFLDECIKVNGNFYDYSMVVYKNNKTNVYIICPEHGIFSQTPKSHLRGDGCIKCNSSKGERKIISLLKDNNVKFDFQYSFENCTSDKNVVLKFDFYLPEFNICVEYDGEQHYRPIEYFGGELAFVKSVRRDEIKNKFCLENNIKLIRIPYNKFEEIEQILISNLCK